MEAVFSCTSSLDCQEKGIHQETSLKTSDTFSSKKADNKVRTKNQCSYSLYDHAQELQKLARDWPAAISFAEDAKPL